MESGYVAVALVLLSVRYRWSNQLSPEPVRAAVEAELVFYATILGLLITVAVLNALVDVYIKRRQLRLAPEEEILDGLVDTLKSAEGAVNHVPLMGADRKTLSRKMEWVAVAMEARAGIDVGPMNSEERRQVKIPCREMAAKVRQLKRLVFLPTAGDSSRLIAELRRTFAYAAGGEWGSIERLAAEAHTPRGRRLLQLFKAVIGTLLPPAIIGVVLFLNQGLEPTVKSTLIGAAVLWPIINVLQILDPQAEGRAANVMGMSEKLRGP